ncbi:MAG: type II/IV secretion system protein [Planctomycetes bacterium]|nr:type II/IV secretion system protein [Planctomycetota bacterium]
MTAIPAGGALVPTPIQPDDVAAVCDTLLADAVADGASDVHLEAVSEGLIVRVRIDGRLRDVKAMPTDTARRVVGHLKAFAGMDIAERRRPQDGRIAFWAADREVDLRITSIGSLHGENLAIRIFDRANSLRDLDDLGLDRESYNRVLDLVRQPQGLILVTGPTGAGKTITLYGMLRHLNRPERAIVTVENPIEYAIERVSQIAVQPRLSLGFGECLRAVLRLDPDVLMIGEIRDAESARIAVRAALAGHLVLTTLHTGTAAGALSALVHYGVEPFLIASALTGVIAQQLVRLICPECREQLDMSVEDLAPDEASEIRRILGAGQTPSFSYGKGCARCRGTGFRGRTGIFEVLVVDDAIRRHVIARHPACDIENAARAAGMRSLRMSGFEKIVRGLVPIEEVLRVVAIAEEQSA